MLVYLKRSFSNQSKWYLSMNFRRKIMTIYGSLLCFSFGFLSHFFAGSSSVFRSFAVFHFFCSFLVFIVVFVFFFCCGDYIDLWLQANFKKSIHCSLGGSNWEQIVKLSISECQFSPILFVYSFYRKKKASIAHGTSSIERLYIIHEKCINIPLFESCKVKLLQAPNITAKSIMHVCARHGFHIQRQPLVKCNHFITKLCDVIQ